ncbi:MAG: hypothetical protein ACK5SH_10365 [Pseudomonadota bacterium]
MKQKKVESVKERGRWSAKSKREAVLKLLRGEDIDAVSRELIFPPFDGHRVGGIIPPTREVSEERQDDEERQGNGRSAAPSYRGVSA